MTDQDQYLSDFGKSRVEEFADEKTDTSNRWKDRGRYYGDLFLGLVQFAAGIGVLLNIATMLITGSWDVLGWLAFHVALLLGAAGIRKWAIGDWWWYDGF